MFYGIQQISNTYTVACDKITSRQAIS